MDAQRTMLRRWPSLYVRTGSSVLPLCADCLLKVADIADVSFWIDLRGIYGSEGSHYARKPHVPPHLVRLRSILLIVPSS